MMPRRARNGFTMVETLLFLGILSIMGTVIVGVILSTQEARVRQQGIAALEQRGTQVLQSLTRRMRRAETILYPASNSSGTIIVLQMAINGEHPTIFAQSGGDLMMIEKQDVSYELGDDITMSNLTFRNVGGVSATVSFDLTARLKLPVPKNYSRRFQGNVTLFPDDKSESGGCGTCPAVTCGSGKYFWYYCSNDTCEQSVDAVSC